MSLDKTQREEIRQHMAEKLASVRLDIDAYKALNRPVSPDSAIGRLTRMEAIQSKSINESALREAEATRTRLERALSGIGHPDFGLCRECDEPIPIARLKAMPGADLCVGCAEEING